MTTKSSRRQAPELSKGTGNPVSKIVIPKVQATQFNDRLVSSTPDMGSPTSESPNPNSFTEPPNQPMNSSPHRDASLEALAAQIRMLRSQADIAELAQQQQGSDNIPVRDTLHYTHPELQEQVLLKPHVVQHDKIGGPGHMMRNLTDHLQDVNMRNQNVQKETVMPQRNFEETRPQIKQHHLPHDQHQVQVLPPPPPQVKVTADTGQKRTNPNNLHHQPPAPFEHPESVNTSFISEYHQLPDENIKPGGNGEQILNQLKEIQTASAIPMPHQNTFHSIGHSHDSTHSKTVMNPNNIKHTPTHHVETSQIKPSHPCDSPQLGTLQVADQHTHQPKLTPNRTKQPAPQMICMGTQTYSPPADKGVQTSAISSPSSPDIKPTTDCPDGKPSPDTDSNRNVLTREDIVATLQDTPHPQPKVASGRKSASWEQMRVLRFLLGELRAAMGDTGEFVIFSNRIVEDQRMLFLIGFEGLLSELEFNPIIYYPIWGFSVLKI